MNVVKFLKYNKNRKITVEAWVYCMWYRFVVFNVPMRFLENHFGIREEETPEEVTRRDYYWAYRAAYEVNRIADKTPWDSKCLVRALAARKILLRRGVHTTLYLGVGTLEDKKQMIAHAWLRCGTFYVTGGDGKEYAMVAKFKN